jgi:legumain
LGDLYAVSVAEHADATDETKETLTAEYNYLKVRVSQNGTYDEGSHVMQYGQTNIASEPVATFLGTGNKVLQFSQM